MKSTDIDSHKLKMTDAVTRHSYSTPTVEKIDATSRVMITILNAIGTEESSSIVQMFADSPYSSILDWGYRLVYSAIDGVLQESKQNGQPPFIIREDLNELFHRIGSIRSPTYIRSILDLDELCLDNLQGNIKRFVYEDVIAKNMIDGYSLPVVGVGQLQALPLWNDGELVSLNACDSYGNIFEIKEFRIGMQQPFCLAFKPSQSGIGALKPQNTGRDRLRIRLEANSLAVINNTQEKLTYVNCCNLENMDWTVLRGYNCEIAVRTNDGLNEWQRDERLLSIIAHAARQGIELGVYMGEYDEETATYDIFSSKYTHEEFVRKCQMEGLEIPSELVSYGNLFIEMNQSSKEKPRCLYIFGGNGPVTAFEVLKSTDQYKALNRLLIVDKGLPKLLIIPDDLSFDVKRTLMKDVHEYVQVCTKQKLTSPEAFNRAAHQAKALAVYLFGFNLTEDKNFLKQIMEWGLERKISVSCVFFGQTTTIQSTDCYLFDSIFHVEEVKKLSDEKVKEISPMGKDESIDEYKSSIEKLKSRIELVKFTRVHPQPSQAKGKFHTVSIERDDMWFDDLVYEVVQ